MASATHSPFPCADSALRSSGTTSSNDLATIIDRGSRSETFQPFPLPSRSSPRAPNDSKCATGGAVTASAQRLDLDSALRQLGHVLLRGYGFVGREDAGLPDLTAHLHLSGDGERVAGRPLHGADVVL